MKRRDYDEVMTECNCYNVSGNWNSFLNAGNKRCYYKKTINSVTGYFDIIPYVCTMNAFVEQGYCMPSIHRHWIAVNHEFGRKACCGNMWQLGHSRWQAHYRSLSALFLMLLSWLMALLFSIDDFAWLALISLLCLKENTNKQQIESFVRSGVISEENIIPTCRRTSTFH